MRRSAQLLLFAGTAGAVLLLSKAHAVRHGYDYTTSSRFGWSVAYIVVLLVAAYAAGLPDLTATRRASLLASLGSSAAGGVAISILQLATGSPLLPRFVVFGTSLVLVPLYLLCSTLAADGRARDARRDRLVVVADLDEVAELGDGLAAKPERSAVLAGALAPQAAASEDPRARPLVDLVAASRATVVILNRRAQADESIVAQAAALHEAGTRIRTLSLGFEEWLGKVALSELERVSLMFDIGEVHRARYGRVKRIIDVLAAFVGLFALVLLVPVVVVGDRLAGPGPLFYRQERTGKHGRPFRILKFRTMTADGSTSGWTTDDDPRVTRFGAWLRRTHLDELPQVLNIMKGDLSVVGPRPEQPQYVAELTEKLPFYDLRHLVRPGLTGWAQVKCGYGASEADALEKLQHEFYYLRHQSLALDLRIVGRTTRCVIERGGR